MAIEYELDEKTGVATVTMAGEFSFEDAINLLRALWGDPKYRFRLLVDARSGKTTPRDPAFFRRLAKR